MEFDQELPSPGQVEGVRDSIKGRLGRLTRMQRLLLVFLGMLCVLSALGGYWWVARAVVKPPLPPHISPAPPNNVPSPVTTVTAREPASAIPALATLSVASAPAVPLKAETADTRLMSPEEFKAGFENDLKENSQLIDSVKKHLESDRQSLLKVPAARPSAVKGDGARIARHAATKVNRKVAKAGRQLTPLPRKLPINVIKVKYNDLMTAVICKDSDAVTQLLDLGWWVDRPDQTGLPPLLEAVKLGDAKMVELLLMRRAEVNTRGGSALKIARRNQDLVMEELLLSYGAH